MSEDLPSGRSVLITVGGWFAFYILLSLVIPAEIAVWFFFAGCALSAAVWGLVKFVEHSGQHSRERAAMHTRIVRHAVEQERAGLPSRAGDQAPNAVQPAGTVKDAARDLAREISAFQARIKPALKALEKAQSQHLRAVENSSQALESQRHGARIAALAIMKGSDARATMTLYEDRIVTEQGTFTLDESVQAIVESAGNMSVTRRQSLTRFMVLGPVGLFFPIATEHDDRELYLSVESTSWAFVARVFPELGQQAREMAQRINKVARDSTEVPDLIAARVARAERSLATAQGDERAIDQALKSLALTRRAEAEALSSSLSQAQATLATAGPESDSSELRRLCKQAELLLRYGVVAGSSGGSPSA